MPPHRSRPCVDRPCECDAFRPGASGLLLWLERLHHVLRGAFGPPLPGQPSTARRDDARHTSEPLFFLMCCWRDDVSHSSLHRKKRITGRTTDARQAIPMQHDDPHHARLFEKKEERRAAVTHPRGHLFNDQRPLRVASRPLPAPPFCLSLSMPPMLGGRDAHRRRSFLNGWPWCVLHRQNRFSWSVIPLNRSVSKPSPCCLRAHPLLPGVRTAFHAEMRAGVSFFLNVWHHCLETFTTLLA